MAVRASAVNKGVLVAAICVALVVSWVGEPAQGSSLSCAMHRCIAECPSKCDKEAASSCEGVQAQDEVRCRYYCGRDCPQGTTCDCDTDCKKPGPTYTGCVYGLSQQCQDKCVSECKGEKSE